MYIHKYADLEVHCYLCKRMEQLPSEDLEQYLPQLVALFVFYSPRNADLEELIAEHASKSVQFALQVVWLLRAEWVEGSKLHGREDAEKLLQRIINLENRKPFRPASSSQSYVSPHKSHRRSKSDVGHSTQFMNCDGVPPSRYLPPPTGYRPVFHRSASFSVSEIENMMGDLDTGILRTNTVLLTH